MKGIGPKQPNVSFPAARLWDAPGGACPADAVCLTFDRACQATHNLFLEDGKADEGRNHGQ